MYIAIEGVIGVGKTSLVRLLRPKFGAEELLEVFEENPFLSNFYGDRERYAFQTQMFFLLSRYHQQRRAVPETLTRAPLIADYTFAKDALFARINLKGDELELYDNLHNALGEKIPMPDLIVYLRAATTTLMQRIAQRDRPYERQMESGYIDQLNRAYDSFFAHHPYPPVLTIDVDQLDFVARPDDLQLIESRIRSALKMGAYQESLPLEEEPTHASD